MSISRRFKQKVLAQKNAAQIQKPSDSSSVSVAVAAPSNGDALTKLKESLSADLATLKLANGAEEKAPFKATLIEKYQPLVESLMASHQDWANLDVVFWHLMWRLDLEGFEAVREAMLQAIDHGLTTPIDFRRDWPTFYLDTVFVYTNDALKAETEFNPEFIKDAVVKLNAGELVTNAPLKAKLYAINGKAAMKNNEFDQAVKNFEAALSLDDKVGVKKLLSEAKTKAGTDGK